MRKDMLLKTNVFVCIVIMIGFIITSAISYRSNERIFKQDVEHVSSLTSESIYYQIESIFTKPINISLTMANDSLLKDFLTNEKETADENIFIENMQRYLLAYRTEYEYDSIFLISTQTNRYYHFNGVDRILKPENPENDWYYSFLKTDEEYSLNIDNDEATNNEITIFINCKIKDSNGNIMGVVGVGFRVDYFQELLKEYENRFHVQAYLVNQDGKIEISTDQTGYQAADLFENRMYSEMKNRILLNDKEKIQTLWYSFSGQERYIVARYVPNLEWYLIIDNNTSALNQRFSWQLFRNIIVVLVVIGLVLFMITRIIHKYNEKIIRMTIEKEQKHRTIFQAATERMYENIYEIDITHNCAGSEATEQYFKSLGVPKNTSYDKALQMIAHKQIKEEYRSGYIATFSPSNVRKTYEEGRECLHYDFMISSNGKTYYWMRITAHIVYWDDDESIRMFVYRQNIDAQKRQEEQMQEEMQRDSLSGLYNKIATQKHIQRMLMENPEKLYAFFIMDIDNFKSVNDTYGHATGDLVISGFAKTLQNQFRSEDIIGRIGGDEFVCFLPAPSKEWIEKKAKSLVSSFRQDFINNSKMCKISVSIGVAIAPENGTDFNTVYRNADIALYCTKKRGKDGFTIYSAH